MQITSSFTTIIVFLLFDLYFIYSGLFSYLMLVGPSFTFKMHTSKSSKPRLWWFWHHNCMCTFKRIFLARTKAEEHYACSLVLHKTQQHTFKEQDHVFLLQCPILTAQPSYWFPLWSPFSLQTQCQKPICLCRWEYQLHRLRKLLNLLLSRLMEKNYCFSAY